MLRPPDLPTEILGEIIDHVWCSDLTPTQRNHFFTTSLLVNKFWLSLFLRTATSDVYIPSRAFMYYYFDLATGARQVCTFVNLSDLGLRCRSVTINITNPNIPPDPIDSDILDTLEPGELLSDFLDHIHDLKTWPNLKNLCVRFTNVPCNDLFEYYRLVDFPLQIESLSLEYAFTSRVPAGSQGGRCLPIPKYMVETPEFLLDEDITWTLPSVRNLRIVGGYEGLVKLALMCPKIEQVSLESWVFWNSWVRRVMAGTTNMRISFVYNSVLPENSSNFLREATAKKGDKLWMSQRLKDGSLHFVWWLSDTLTPGDMFRHKSILSIPSLY